MPENRYCCTILAPCWHHNLLHFSHFIWYRTSVQYRQRGTAISYWRWSVRSESEIAVKLMLIFCYIYLARRSVFWANEVRPDHIVQITIKSSASRNVLLSK